MKLIIPFFLLVFFGSGIFAGEGTLTVAVLSSEAGSGLTEIEYTFTGHEDLYNISAEVSFDNGASFDPIPAAHLTGDLTNVAPGGPYSLTWDGGASFPDRYSENTVVRLTATLGCGDTYSVTFTYNGEEVTYGTVWRNGLCWLDRNLGASRVPTASDDSEGYGDLFQWGRGDDGHQDRTSTTTSTLSTSDVPGHGDFITVSDSPWDWRSPQNDDLWQGVDGINNPCPPGWRLPTMAELEAERLSWDPNNNATGAFASDLKWPVDGIRSNLYGTLGGEGSGGYVWTSSVSGTIAKALYFSSDFASVNYYNRARGISVRCVRD